MTRSDFGGLLRGLRVRAGLGQDELASQAGLSVRAVRELEAGRVSRPRPRTVHRLISALDLAVADARALLAAVGAADAAAGLRVEILGPLAVRDDTTAIAVRRPKLRTLLGLLALHAGRAVPIDEIVTALWGEAAPRSAPSQVQVYVTQLRQLVEPGRDPGSPSDRVVHSSEGYRLRIDDDESDAAEFRQAVSRAAKARAQGDRDAAARSYAEALDTWRGPVLADVPVLGDHPEAVALARQRIDAALAFADLAADRDAHARAAGWLQELAHDEPLHEALAARLMLALTATGEQAAALALFDRIRARLDEELGVGPGADLREAHLRVLRQQSGAPVPAQLPLGIRGFTGRHAALTELDGLLDSGYDLPSAVVISAVSGTAGVGKTTLAVHWGHRVAQRFPDGQLYIDLRGFDPGGQITTPAEAIRGFLDALGVTPERVPSSIDAQAALYRSLLAGKRVLVVLDNARDSDQVRPLLPGTATAFTIVTSRDRLGGLVATHAARPLGLDVLSAAEARHLLASRLGHDRVAAEPGAVDAIVAACAHLPLALAIAAARAQQSGEPLATVARQLAARRLDVLDAGDPASRIRAVLSWSFSALTPPGARLFRLLGLHPGPDIDVAAAASLAGVPEAEAGRLLAELVDANLLTEHVDGRFRFHDLLRAYAVDTLAAEESEVERQAATRRMLDYYVHTLYAAEKRINPQLDPIPLPTRAPAEGVRPGQPGDNTEALAWCTAEQAALLRLLRLAAQTGFDTHAWQLAWTLDTVITRRGSRTYLAEIWQIAARAAERLGEPVAQSQAHQGLAHAYLLLGEHDKASAELQRSLERAVETGDTNAVAFTHRLIAQVHWRRGDLPLALHHGQLMLALLRDGDDPQHLAIALNAVGWYHALLGDHAAAIAHCEEGLGLCRQIGNQLGQARTHDTLGYAYHHLGEHARAVDNFREALVLFRALGDRYSEADTLSHLAETYLSLGDTGRAQASWRSALEILTDLDHPEAEEVRAKLARLTSAPAAAR